MRWGHQRGFDTSGMLIWGYCNHQMFGSCISFFAFAVSFGEVYEGSLSSLRLHNLALELNEEVVRA